MSSRPNARLALTKAVLWLLVGAASAVGVVRYLMGLGLTTALTDRTPWGLWIGFDVLAGVALAAGGFVIAGAVHVFHLERYHAMLRPAILTAFLGYVAVVVGLLIDLGRPWNIWRPTVFWQPHSALFEVAWCVMLYLTVLALEFAPVVAEGLRWQKVVAFLRRLTLPLVAVGIALSSLHQSSLGTLLVIAPNRLHPLWYSPLLPLLFLVSAVALGLAMVCSESIVSAWLFHREPEWEPIGGLTRAAAVVLALYLALRIGDLAVRRQLHHLFSGSWFAGLFLLELAISAVVPLIVFSLPSARRDRRAMTVGAFLSVAGFVMYRVDAGGLSHVSATGEGYFPSLTELTMSLGVVAAMGLIFLFFVEHLRVWEEPPKPKAHFRPALADPTSAVRVRAPWLGGTQRAALAWTVGAVLGFGLVEARVAHRSTTRPFPVAVSRSVAVTRIPGLGGGPARLLLATGAPTPPPGLQAELALLVSNSTADEGVLFAHAAHQARLGAALASCDHCHHRNFPSDRGTPCSACHRDLYTATDTFDHERHVAATGRNDGCVLCHVGGDTARTRTGSTPCDTCHARDVRPLAQLTRTASLPPGIAAGYRDAMHGLCIGCHHREDLRRGEPAARRSRCTFCHRSARPGATAATDVALGEAVGTHHDG
jgi:Ni/Fe-hydrogenase subunit HybB-like protein